jgi:uncharacterized membrane protein
MLADAFDQLQRLALRYRTWLLYAVVLVVAAWAGNEAGSASNEPLMLGAGIALVLLFVYEPSLALAAVLVALVFGSRWTLRLPGLKITAAKIMTALAFGTWAVRSFLDRKPFLRTMPATFSYLVLAAWMATTSVASLYPTRGATQLATLFMLGGMCHLIYTVLDEQRFVKFMNVFAAVGVIALVLGAFRGMADERSSGVVRNANEWAAVALMIGYPTLGWISGWSHRLRVPLLLLIVPLIPLNVAQTASRAGLAAFLLTVPGMIYVLRRERFVLLSGAAIAMALFSVVVTQSDLLQERVIALQAVDRKDGSLNVRLDLLEHGLNVLREHPIFGVGLGNVMIYNAELFPVGDVRMFHNSYLYIAVEQGLPGLVLHLVVLAFWGSLMARAARHGRSQRMRAVGMGTALGLGTWAFASLTGDDLMSYPTAHFCLGVGLALERLSRSTAPLPEALRDPEPDRAAKTLSPRPEEALAAR